VRGEHPAAVADFGGEIHRASSTVFEGELEEVMAKNLHGNDSGIHTTTPAVESGPILSRHEPWTIYRGAPSDGQ
jgi:hypothetical protein